MKSRFLVEVQESHEPTQEINYIILRFFRNCHLKKYVIPKFSYKLYSARFRVKRRGIHTCEVMVTSGFMVSSLLYVPSQPPGTWSPQDGDRCHRLL